MGLGYSGWIYRQDGIEGTHELRNVSGNRAEKYATDVERKNWPHESFPDALYTVDINGVNGQAVPSGCVG